MVAERPIPVLTESEEGPPMEPTSDGTEPEVYWIVPRAWEDELAVQVVRGVPCGSGWRSCASGTWRS